MIYFTGYIFSLLFFTLSYINKGHELTFDIIVAFMLMSICSWFGVTYCVFEWLGRNNELQDE